MSAPPDLLPRVNAFLQRLIKWLEATLDELAALEALLKNEDFDKLEALQTRHEKETEHLRREYNGLRYEWERAQNIAPQEREAVHTRSERAQALTEKLRTRYEEAGVLIQREMARNQSALNALRRGHSMLDKFRPGLPQEPGFIDRKA